jgi:hypothetical protein
MDVRFDQPRLARPPHDAVLKWPAKKLWKYGDNIESHYAHITANTLQPDILRE